MSYEKNFWKAIWKALLKKAWHDALFSFNIDEMNIFKALRNSLIIVCIAILTFSYIKTLSECMNVSELINSGLLLATLLVIIWYTIETNNMHKAMVQQTNVTIKPYFILECNSEGDIAISNIGNGVAINVKIAPIYILYNNIILHFKNIAFVSQGSSIIVNYLTSDIINELDINFPCIIYRSKEKFVNNGLIVDFFYEDILKNKHQQTVYLASVSEKIIALFNLI